MRVIIGWSLAGSVERSIGPAEIPEEIPEEILEDILEDILAGIRRLTYRRSSPCFLDLRSGTPRVLGEPEAEDLIEEVGE